MSGRSCPIRAILVARPSGGWSGGRRSQPGLRALFDRDQHWQRYLDVEALDVARVEAAVARSSHPLLPLIVELSRVVGEPHGGWVH
jgi:3-carboxy-cis,cis-muconate cycloisomerase